MKTKLSSKGQIVLPAGVRRRMGLVPGEELDVRMDGDRVVLSRRNSPVFRVKLVIDPLTGLPVLTAGKRPPGLTGGQVAELLADFP